MKKGCVVSVLCSCGFLMGMVLLVIPSAWAREYHVSPSGDDAHEGSPERMLRTVAAAARLAQPGDTVIVHEGVYREQVNPPRGGTSDELRIVYQAAPGERVEIRGSERIQGWERVQHDAWKVVLPNTFFGDYNPYAELIRGDWFDPRGREHHTGAVYLDGHWLVEAAELEEVLATGGTLPGWLQSAGSDYLLNVAWMRPHAESLVIPAVSFSAKHGTQNAPCSEGGECIGFIRHGHWVTYPAVDFQSGTQALEIRAASASRGGVIQVRADGPQGEVLGSCVVPHTGGWQSWISLMAEIVPTSGVKDICLVFHAPAGDSLLPSDTALWFAQASESHTTIWAQFKGVNPNEREVEINVRRAVFYPEQPGRNYITVRGFVMRHAATPWAPPTAQQIGLIGTHWSKGWIIEDNVISHSVCSGVSLGKHGDEFDNTSADTAEGYVLTIERAIAQGWHRDRIGGHIVRNNHISHCEQTGIVGSLGPVFSRIIGNTIHDIHVRRLFSGAEMAGIKLHAAIDVEIRGNHIYRTCRGLWLDWMAQGARVTGNLFHENHYEDLFVEVNHGPFVVDNNIFLSPISLLDVSRGGAFIHNLMAGEIRVHHYDARLTPYHHAHTTAIAGMHDNPSGDDRYYNNIFTGRGGLAAYDQARLPVFMGGNVFFNEAQPSVHESNPLVHAGVQPGFALREGQGKHFLTGALEPGWDGSQKRSVVDSQLLGAARVSGLPYENADGSPLRIDYDYYGNTRTMLPPQPGPVEFIHAGAVSVRVY